MTQTNPIEPEESGQIARKIDKLFRTVHPPGKKEYTLEEVAEKIRAQGGPSLSPSYIWSLRKGTKTNPTVDVLIALARAFKVPPKYFFEEEASAEMDAQLERLAEAMEDSRVRGVALRMEGLSPESLERVSDMVEHMRKLENLREDVSRPPQRKRRRRPVDEVEPEDDEDSRT